MQNKQDKIINDLNDLGIDCLIANEPLYKHTTFKVGGPALVYVDAKSLNDITDTIDYARRKRIKYLILGNGSNVLIADSTFNGIVICTKKYDRYEIKGKELVAFCGANLIELAYKSAEAGLSGLEFASGIPGSIGGAVYMNAGAYKKDMASVVKQVLVYKDRKMFWLNKKDMNFSYRHSIIQENSDMLIIAVILRLKKGNKDDILELINKRKERRLKTQPCNAYSAGSIFKNPSDEIFSWKLIDNAGMRGYKINDAKVSTKHSNFIINKDRASAKDIYDLINLVQEKVLYKDDIFLKIEVELINFEEE